MSNNVQSFPAVSTMRTEAGKASIWDFAVTSSETKKIHGKVLMHRNAGCYLFSDTGCPRKGMYKVEVEGLKGEAGSGPWQPAINT